jgi:superfamily I DNA/RNA helicase
MPLLVALDRVLRETGASPEVRGSLLGWAAGTDREDLGPLRTALGAAREALGRLHRDDADLTLATVHGTKGLEWDHVACVGFDEGGFPSARSIREAPDRARALEEERRLAYVAWTRARRSLAILHDPGAPSVFLREAFDPEELSAWPDGEDR